MTQNEIEAGNKVIAESIFSGLFIEQFENSGGKGEYVKSIQFPQHSASYYEPNKAREYVLRCLNIFHKDWNALMPVVEKIEAMGLAFPIEKNIAMICANYGEFGNQDADMVGQYVLMGHIKGETKIEATWLAVVEFIKWYNQQK